MLWVPIVNLLFLPACVAGGSWLFVTEGGEVPRRDGGGGGILLRNLLVVPPSGGSQRTDETARIKPAP